MIVSLNKLETDLIEKWRVTVPKQCDDLLKLPLFARRPKSNELQLNFHPEVYKLFLIQYFNHEY